MMEQDLRSLLSADATIAAYVSSVDWDETPQGRSPPYLVLEMGFDPRDKHMGGPQVTRKTRVRAKCWGSKPGEAHALKNYVIDAVEATPADQGSTRFLGIFPNVLGGLREDSPTGIRHCQIVDLDVVHTPIP